MTRILYRARSPHALAVAVPIAHTVEPGLAGYLVDSIYPGHPRRSAVVVAISAGAHLRAEEAYRGPIEAAVRQLARLSASEEAA